MAQDSRSSIGLSPKGSSTRNRKAQIVRCANLAVGSLVSLVGAMSAQATSITIFDFNNAIMQPAGPRTGNNGKINFNVEGDNNGSNANYGVIDFHGGDFGTPTATSVNSFTLTLTENNAAFSAPGSVEVFLASDASANIDPGTATAPNYQSGIAPPFSGIGNTTAFGTLTDLGSIAFNQTGNSNSGVTDFLSLSSLSAPVNTFLTNQLTTNGTIRLILTPKTVTTAATWTGVGNNNFNAPQLGLDVSFPATGQRTLTFNPGPSFNGNLNTTDSDMLDSTNNSTMFVQGDTVVFPNLNSTNSFSSAVTVDAGGAQPALSQFTHTVGTYTISGGPLGDTAFGTGRSSLVMNGGSVGTSTFVGGTVKLTTPNAFTGGVFVNAGTLIIDNDNELGGTGTFATLNLGGGTVLINNNINSSRTVKLTVPNGALNPTSKFNTNGFNATFGGLSTAAGSSIQKFGAGSLIFTGTVAFANNTGTQTSALTVSSGTFVFAQTVPAQGDGTLIFNNAVAAGTLNAGTAATGFTGDVAVETPSQINLNNGTIQGGGSVFIDVSGALIGDHGGSATAPLSAGIVNKIILNRNNVGGLNNNQNLPFTANFGANGSTSSGGTTNFSSFTFGSRNTLSLGGVISGNADVNFGDGPNANSADGVAGGDGIVLLSASNTYTGATRITTGTFNNAGNPLTGQVAHAPSYGLVRIGVNNALPAATSVTFGSSSTVATAHLDIGALDLFGHSQTVAYLATDPGINSAAGISNFSSETLGSNSGALGTLIINNGSHAQMSFNASIGALTDNFSSTGALVISNDNIALQLANTNNGSLQLARPSTYTGGTIIGGGTLSLGDPNALGFGSDLPIGRTVIGSTTISTGGVLDLSGQTVNEPINLSGGTLLSSNGGGTINNGIKGVGFTAAGAGISGDASINFSGAGGGAQATPLLAVTRATITSISGGSGYTSVPRVIISGGGGNSALATALMGITNTSITVSNQGTGYTTAPTVTFNTPSGGVAATGHALIDGSGHVTSVVVDTAGKGYTAAPTVTFGAVTGASGAVATGSLTGLVVTDVSITSGGQAFTSTPTITFTDPPSGGVTATATADNAHYTLVGIQATSAGSGYVSSTATLNSSTGAGGAVLGSAVLPTLTLLSTGGIGGDNDINLLANVTGAGGFTKFGNDTVTISGNTTYTGNVTLSSGTLVFAGSTGWNAALGGTASTSVNGGTLVFDYTNTTFPTATLRSRLATSYAGGVNSFTTGPFRSTGADSRHGLGYFDDGSSKVTVKLTYYGDADLSGAVDTSDFMTLSQHFGSTNATWQTGDFNYDGMVNALDFNAIATNFGAPPIAAPALGTLVPEPASLALLGCAGLLGLRKRRRA
jgi:autotransporter-associated beta strand protein